MHLCMYVDRFLRKKSIEYVSRCGDDSRTQVSGMKHVGNIQLQPTGGVTVQNSKRTMVERAGITSCDRVRCCSNINFRLPAPFPPDHLPQLYYASKGDLEDDSELQVRVLIFGVLVRYSQERSDLSPIIVLDKQAVVARQ